ncbi:MAG: OsmC family protein [Nitrospinota bacterium]
MEIHLSFQRSLTPKFHKDYHGDPERRKNMIAKLVSDVYIRGDVTEEQKAILLDDLKHCPLHNTLSRPPELEERIHVLDPYQEMPRYQ